MSISSYILTIYLILATCDAVSTTTPPTSVPNNDTSGTTIIPLTNELHAPLVAVMDMTSINNGLKIYIKQIIDNYISNMMITTATAIVDEKLEARIPLLQSLKDTVDAKLQELQTKSSQVVAFYAVISGDPVTLGTQQTVIFDKVYTNIGNAYNAYTGSFTVPVNGLYVIDFTFTEISKGLHMQMVANDNEIGRGHASNLGGAGTGSIHAIVSLNKNDVVRVRHYSSTTETIHGENWSSFSGHLISAFV